MIRAREGHVFRSCFLPRSAAGVASSSGSGRARNITSSSFPPSSASSSPTRQHWLRSASDPGYCRGSARQSVASIRRSLVRSAVGRRSRVNRRQLHIARFPPGARRSDARSRANVARLPCRIPRNLCHVEEATLSLVAANDRNGAKMSTKGEAEERVRQ